MKPFTIIANWKTNPPSVHEAGRLAHASDGFADIIIPPAPFLDRVAAELRLSELGSQDVSSESGTGSISGKMLTSVGVSYVIIGHSERRAAGDSDEIVREKILAATGAKLRAILCVGEPLVVRRKGLPAAKKFVAGQIRSALGKSTSVNRNSLFIAYEPIWAIGSGRADTPESAGEMASFIKGVLKASHPKLSVSVLYGGSVVPGNAKALGIPDSISGFLIGGASLSPAKLKLIRKLVSNRYEENR